MPLAIGAIGAIGHRDLVPSEIDGLRARVASFLVALQRNPQLRVTLLTSLADGADRLAAGVANSLQMPVTDVLPMPSALFEQDFAADSPIEAHIRDRLVGVPKVWRRATSHRRCHRSAGDPTTDPHGAA